GGPYPDPMDAMAFHVGQVAADKAFRRTQRTVIAHADQEGWFAAHIELAAADGELGWGCLRVGGKRRADHEAACDQEIPCLLLNPAHGALPLGSILIADPFVSLLQRVCRGIDGYLGYNEEVPKPRSNSKPSCRSS